MAARGGGCPFLCVNSSQSWVKIINHCAAPKKAKWGHENTNFFRFRMCLYHRTWKALSPHFVPYFASGKTTLLRHNLPFKRKQAMQIDLQLGEVGWPFQIQGGGLPPPLSFIMLDRNEGGRGWHEPGRRRACRSRWTTSRTESGHLSPRVGRCRSCGQMRVTQRGSRDAEVTQRDWYNNLWNPELFSKKKFGPSSGHRWFSDEARRGTSNHQDQGSRDSKWAFFKVNFLPEKRLVEIENMAVSRGKGSICLYPFLGVRVGGLWKCIACKCVGGPFRFSPVVDIGISFIHCFKRYPIKRHAKVAQ